MPHQRCHLSIRCDFLDEEAVVGIAAKVCDNYIDRQV